MKNNLEAIITASLAVHAAMAGAMADVITDCKITQNCAIDQTFVLTS